ncbi:MAG: glycosyltransferase family 39 protein [Pirellulales bacterium]
MLGRTRPQLLLAAIAGLMFFVNLGATHLWDVDEAIFSQAAKEMHQRGDAVVPYFNGQVFPDKPALMYWLMIGAYELFGPTEFAARFWSAVFGIGSVLLTYRLGRLVFSPPVAFWSGLILATSLNFTVVARAATPDSFLVFFSTLAVLLFVLGTAKAQARRGEANERNAPWAGQTRFEPSWLSYALVYAAMGFGVLTKGPIGVVLPTATIGLFLLIVRAGPVPSVEQPGWGGSVRSGLRRTARVFAPLHILRAIWSMRPLTAIGAVLAVAGPWYAWVGVKTQGEWLVGFFGVHNFGRFVGAMDNHGGPIYYYLVAIAVGFFPWSVLAGPALWHMSKLLKESHPWRPGYVLLGSWIAVWVGFFSLAGTKLPSYIVPAYPALALVTGCFVASWIGEPALLPRVWPRLIWGCVALVGVGLMVALPFAAQRYLGGEWMLGAIGLIPLAAAAAGWVFCRRGQTRYAALTLAGLGVVLWITVFGFVAVYVDRYQESPAFARRIAENSGTGPPPAIASFHHFRPSYVLYTQRVVERIETPDEVRSFFAAHAQGAFVITNDGQYDRLRGSLPPDVTVLETRRRLGQRGHVLLLGRAKPSATATKSPIEAGSPLR